MSELITITYDNDRPTVSGRALHEALEVKTPYHKWFDRMTEYGFTAGSDYQEVMDKNDRNPQGGRPWRTGSMNTSTLTIWPRQRAWTQRPQTRRYRTARSE